LSIFLTSNDRISKINEEYTGVRRPTDVLSFRLADPPSAVNFQSGATPYGFQWDLDGLRNKPYLDLDTGELISPQGNEGTEDTRVPVTEIPKDLGSVFLAPDYCSTRCLKPVELRLCDYALLATMHGIGHLVGYNHDTPAQYEAMRGAEVEVLKTVEAEVGLAAAIQDPRVKNVPASYLR